MDMVYICVYIYINALIHLLISLFTQYVLSINSPWAFLIQVYIFKFQKELWIN